MVWRGRLERSGVVEAVLEERQQVRASRFCKVPAISGRQMWQAGPHGVETLTAAPGEPFLYHGIVPSASCLVVAVAEALLVGGPVS